MIEGLKFCLTSSDLAAQLRGRAEYHEGRAAEKREILPQLRETMDMLKGATGGQVKDVTRMSKTLATYNLDPDDPIESLERDIRNHHNRALTFRFLAEHVHQDDYSLSWSDLNSLEITQHS